MLKPLPFTVTMPPRDDFYLVSEKQIEDLSETSKDYALEIALATGGAGIGLLPQLISFGRDVWATKQVTGWDIVLALLCVVLLVLSAAKFSQRKSKGDSKQALKDRIKSGQKAIVAGG